MRFFTPSQLAKLTPRSRRFWCDRARAGELPGSVFFADRASTLSNGTSGEWWISEAGFLEFLRRHGLSDVVVLPVIDEPVSARSVGELRRKVAA